MISASSENFKFAANKYVQKGSCESFSPNWSTLMRSCEEELSGLKEIYFEMDQEN